MYYLLTTQMYLSLVSVHIRACSVKLVWLHGDCWVSFLCYMIPVRKIPSPAHPSGINYSLISFRKTLQMTQSVPKLAFNVIPSFRYLFHLNALHSLLNYNILKLGITLFINKPHQMH